MSQPIVQDQVATDDHNDTCSHDHSRPTDSGDHNTLDETDDTDTMTLTLTFHQQPISLTLPTSATISDLSALIETDFSIPPSNQKILISPKPGLLRPPFKDPSLPLLPLSTRKITLLGTSTADIASLNATLTTVRARASARAASLAAARRVQANRYVPPTASTSAQYTFARIAPLSHLPDPQGSTAFLQRLASDRGIIAAMRKWRFSVGLLTEMDPAAHTTHEGRTLGLNRNAGEVVELRLWTDGYEGWRDYRTVRRTLCHELAHNRFSEHNSDFWGLYREIERLVEGENGGRTMGGDFAEEREEEMEHVDGGGWTGGSYVLGGVGDGGLSRRDVLAKAAEERMKRLREGEAEENGGEGRP